jgi:hypothetical protein
MAVFPPPLNPPGGLLAPGLCSTAGSLAVGVPEAGGGALVATKVSPGDVLVMRIVDGDGTSPSDFGGGVKTEVTVSVEGGLVDTVVV